MVGRFIEFSREVPCARGRLERIIDIPTGIDHSFGSPHDLEDQIKAIGYEVHAEFEALYGDFADQVIQEAAASANASTETKADPKEIIAGIKQDMFRHRAEVKLLLERGLPEAHVHALVEQVAPWMEML